MHLKIASSGVVGAGSCLFCVSWLLNFHGFCKSVDIMLLAWNRPQWEWPIETGKYWKADSPTHVGQLLKITGVPLSFIFITTFLDFSFSISLTGLTMGLLLQCTFSKWWREHRLWEGNIKVTIDKLSEVPKLVHFSSTGFYGACVTLIVRHPVNIKKNVYMCT